MSSSDLQTGPLSFPSYFLNDFGLSAYTLQVVLAMAKCASNPAAGNVFSVIRPTGLPLNGMCSTASVYHGFGYTCGILVTGVTGAGVVLDSISAPH